MPCLTTIGDCCATASVPSPELPSQTDASVPGNQRGHSTISRVMIQCSAKYNQGVASAVPPTDTLFKKCSMRLTYITSVYRLILRVYGDQSGTGER